MEPIGQIIRRRRKEIGMRQVELARRAGATQAHISQIESGKITNPGLDAIKRFEKALGISLTTPSDMEDMVPLLGKVVEGQEIVALSDDEPHHVECPYHHPERYDAIRVDVPIGMAYSKGTHLYFAKNDQPPEECVDSPCMVQIGVRRYFLIITRGSRDGLFTLRGPVDYAPIIADTKIDAARPLWLMQRAIKYTPT